jgi:cytochrome c-type biogenesis protein
MDLRNRSAVMRPSPTFTSIRWGILATGIVIALVAALGWLVLAKTQGRDALASTAQLRTSQTTQLTTTLTRTGAMANGEQVDVILTTPEFFKLTNRTSEMVTLGADRSLVFVANENVHYGELPKQFTPILRLDGSRMLVPSAVNVVTDSVHHRTDVVVFSDLPATLTTADHTLEVLLPQNDSGSRAVLQWRTPIAYPDSLENPGRVNLGLLLSLAAGLLAAISPCLLQLTAFYLPTLAGVSMDGQGALALNGRRKVMGTALVFVLGFTIPYTIGGALMGGMGQTLAGSRWLDPKGPIAVGAGIVMIAMAVFVAYRSRTPLVCKLPLPARFNTSKRVPLLTSFFSGLAIATGCLACFGGAILGVLLVYTGLLGSATLGGLAMFLFSMGLAIPFLISALGLSWVMPIAIKAQRLAPAIGLVSSALMLFFGISMATGNYHVVSGWLYQNMPLR